MQTIPEHELKSYDVYVDETCVSQHRYMVIGCIIAETADVPMLATELHIKKTRLGLPHEVKWERVAPRNHVRYAQIADCVFDHVDRDILHFHSIVIDTSKLDHKTFNQGDREIGFSKFVYQLLMKLARLYKPRAKFRVYLDHRTTSQDLRPVRDMLNFKARRSCGMDHFPFRRLQFQDSKKSILIQMADILTGSVGFRTNGKEMILPPMAHRISLSAHICAKAKLASLARQTSPSGRTTIWHFKLSERSTWA